ncbi:MAG: hypothetical protein KBT19_01715 [Lachnospiraceae bacterium]|nr:hypothetical protein [Candidatus Colinaster equi]
MFYKCKNCGGNIVYDPEKGTMCCPHCEGLDSEEKKPGGEDMMRCANCGAPLDEVIKKHTSATKCPNCGTYTIVDERIAGDLEPHRILPFKVSREKAGKLIKAEFEKRIFTPSSFASNASIAKMEGTYVPFFLYDYHANGTYEGKATKVRHWRSGDREYTETSYYRVVRELESDFDSVPVDASVEMDDQYMDLMEPYHYEGFEDFDPKFMSGFLGEKNNESEEALSPRAFKKVVDSVNHLIQASVSGYTSCTKIGGETRAFKKKFEYVLLPVWEYNYKYQGKIYKYHVNGQTGKVVGKTPVAKGRVIAFGATVWFMVSVAAYIATLVYSVL